MVAITPNSYIYNKSAIPLRKYLIVNKYIDEIIDYKSEKVFPNVSTYCCITVINKRKKNYFTYNNKKIKYSDIINDTYNIFEKVNLSGKTLGDICSIKNGIATLRDKIFIHTKKLFNEPCWQKITNSNTDKWIIFPYYENGKIIPETEFKKNNPNTFKYLQDNKIELAKRDKGKKKYPEWYAFGRTQSIIKPKSKDVLYVSTFVDPKNINYIIGSSKLFVSCLCFEPKKDTSLEHIKQILEKNVDYIEENSTKRGGGWINLSASTLKKIPI